MLTVDQARKFAENWIEAWNSHDIDRILDCYSDDFTMITPFIATMFGDPSGAIRGKENIRGYLSKAFLFVPNLKFELIGVFTGVDSVVVHYKAVFGKIGAETMFFDKDGKVAESFAHYNTI